MDYQVVNADVIKWAKRYKGEPFHALLCDPPYHLTSIVKRFGKKGSAPAKPGTDGAFQRASSGFMGQSWDGGELSFDPSTWELLGKLLYPGAFGMAFASSKGWHRLATAIEDAGFVIHPSIFGWLRGSGMPKATRIDIQVVRANGRLEERKTGIRKGTGYTKNNVMQGAQQRFTTEFSSYGNAVSPLAQAWEGHRYGGQVLKPSLEPIIVFQKPYEGRPIDCITQTGAGALNIEQSRLAGNWSWGTQTDICGNKFNQNKPSKGNVLARDVESVPGGRWPGNFYLQHLPECRIVGYRQEGYTINRWDDDAHPFGGGAGNEYTGVEVSEEVPVYECVAGCPAQSLIQQEGTPHFYFQSDWVLDMQDPVLYSQKASGQEKDAGLEDFYWKRTADGFERVTHEEYEALSEDERAEYNIHPTVKPLKLTRYLAGMLLPPEKYAGRLLVPFSGTGSEMIGGVLAGWEQVVGIEKMPVYVLLADARLKFWSGWKARGLSKPADILKMANAQKQEPRPG